MYFRPFYRGSYNTPYLFLRIGNRGPLGCGDVGPKNFGDLVLESLEPYTLEQVTSTKRGKYLRARWFKSWPFDPPIGGHFNPWKGHTSPSQKGHKGIARGIIFFVTYWGSWTFLVPAYRMSPLFSGVPVGAVDKSCIVHLQPGDVLYLGWKNPPKEGPFTPFKTRGPIWVPGIVKILVPNGLMYRTHRTWHAFCFPNECYMFLKYHQLDFVAIVLSVWKTICPPKLQLL